VGDLVLIRQDTCSKLAKPTCGPYWLIDVACQLVNGTIVVDLNHSHETFNIQRLIPFKPRQNHWGRELSYHVPHQSQLNTQSSGLLLCTLSLLENPLTFFTNTCHLSQCYHLSFSTKKDCIFSCNTVVNIDVAPHLPVRHIIT
jgi:hypothetical protein